MVELVAPECSQPGTLTRWSHEGAGRTGCLVTAALYFRGFAFSRERGGDKYI
jgi:hypothetical protein